MWNSRLDEAQAGIKTARRNINNLRYTDDTSLMAESKEELKIILMKVKEESEKAGLKLNIQKMKIMASGPINHGKQMGKQWKTLFSWAPKSLQMVIAAMKLKDAFLLGRKAMTNLDSILKSRDINLPTKVHLVKATVFPVVMYGCKSWIIKKAEHWRINAFELWCWRRLLRVLWTARRSNQYHPKGNQSWMFSGRTDAENEAPIVWPPYAKNWLTGKDPNAGKDWRQEETRMTGNEMVGWHHRLSGHEFEQVSGVGNGQGSLACCSPWGRKESDMTEQLN